MRGEQQARNHASCEEHNAILILERYPRNEPKPQPQFLISRLDDADQDQCASRPGQWLKGIHRDVVIHREANARGEHSQRRECLRKSFSAEFAGNPSGEKYRACAGESGKQADGLQRVTEKQTLDSYDESDQWRLVDISPGQVPATGHKIKLVAEISVKARGIKMNRKLKESDVGDDSRPGGEPRPP
jgi:hypothetical protein